MMIGSPHHYGSLGSDPSSVFHFRPWSTSTTHGVDVPHPDGVLKNTTTPKILHYRRLYADRPDPIVSIPLVVNTFKDLNGKTGLLSDLVSGFQFWKCPGTLS
jgi:hypothetical protein